jgi:hypothetical protein
MFYHVPFPLCDARVRRTDEKELGMPFATDLARHPRSRPVPDSWLIAEMYLSARRIIDRSRGCPAFCMLPRSTVRQPSKKDQYQPRTREVHPMLSLVSVLLPHVVSLLVLCLISCLI